MSFDDQRRVFEKEYRSWEIDLSAFQPLNAGVLLERITEPDGLLVIPDIAKVPIHRGRVLRVGPGKRTGDGTCLPLDVRAGDIVRYQSSDVDNQTHILIEEADILFIEG